MMKFLSKVRSTSMSWRSKETKPHLSSNDKDTMAHNYTVQVGSPAWKNKFATTSSTGRISGPSFGEKTSEPQQLEMELENQPTRQSTEKLQQLEMELAKVHVPNESSGEGTNVKMRKKSPTTTTTDDDGVEEKFGISDEIGKSARRKKKGGGRYSIPVVYVCILVTGLVTLCTVGALFIGALTILAEDISLSSLNYQNRELYPQRLMGIAMCIFFACLLLLVMLIAYFFLMWWANSAKTTRMIHAAAWRSKLVDMYGPRMDSDGEGGEYCMAPYQWLNDETVAAK